jgi:hypothetical protein
MKRTTVTLTDDIAWLLEREAKRRETSMSEVVRDVLAEHYQLNCDPPDPPFGVIAHLGGDIASRLEEALEAEGFADAIENDRGW